MSYRSATTRYPASTSPSDSSSTAALNPNFQIMDKRTLRELAALDISIQIMSIQYSDVDVQCEHKFGLIHLLPKFHGLGGEDPHKHLKEFHTVCTTMKPAGVSEEHIKLKAFPFSLQDVAKDWLYYLWAGSVTSWEGLKILFLEKFFPASRVTSIRKEICRIRQQDRESLYEYWERFKRLCTSCPYHQINKQLLIQYFYEGLMAIDRQMIDVASGGALVDKTPVTARQLIEIMASNNQQSHDLNQLSCSDWCLINQGSSTGSIYHLPINSN
ncbi:hypothetical protein VNO80_15582 [Phaseolus coccineus]|uniref:Retrotransposon gag domain-containing protein n=1 Tax=Phaseolus coccineus TaxID=3886 RepID=A0AAN9R748_PHACN